MAANQNEVDSLLAKTTIGYGSFQRNSTQEPIHRQADIEQTASIFGNLRKLRKSKEKARHETPEDSSVEI